MPKFKILKIGVSEQTLYILKMRCEHANILLWVPLGKNSWQNWTEGDDINLGLLRDRLRGSILHIPILILHEGIATFKQKESLFSKRTSSGTFWFPVFEFRRRGRGLFLLQSSSKSWASGWIR